MSGEYRTFGCDDVENLIKRHLAGNGFEDDMSTRYGTAIGLLMSILSGRSVEDLLQEINKH